MTTLSPTKGIWELIHSDNLLALTPHNDKEHWITCTYDDNTEQKHSDVAILLQAKRMYHLVEHIANYFTPDFDDPLAEYIKWEAHYLTYTIQNTFNDLQQGGDAE